MGRAGFGFWVRARVVITSWEGLIMPFFDQKKTKIFFHRQVFLI